MRKEVNGHALLKEAFTAPGNFKWYLKRNPQFKVIRSALTFNRDRMRFDPEHTLGDPTETYIVPEADQINICYTDLHSQTFTSQKTVLGDVFLVRDSVRKINWKLTGEMRIIAGYECRRANAVIMDSV